MTAAAAAPVVASSSTSSSPVVTWRWSRFEALSNVDVHDLLALRSAVFVVEQRCVFLDADGGDRAAWHLLGRADAAPHALCAYLRCLDPGVRYAEPSIGRVVTSPDARGTGLGRALMDEGIVRTQDAWPGAEIVINAQRRLEAFYRSLGFVAEGEPYQEDDIEHVRMRLPQGRTIRHDATAGIAPVQRPRLDIDRRNG